MPEIKTKPTNVDALAFLEGIENEKKRQDAFALVQLMQEVTGAAPQMWGDTIVGFGKSRYKNAGGSQGEWFMAGFSPRKQNLTLYIMGLDLQDSLLTSLGKYTTGKSCVYVKKLEDVDLNILKALVKQSVDHAAKMTAD